MTIRLTSVIAFEKVLEKLKQKYPTCKKDCESFFKYTVDTIKHGIESHEDEWYLDVEWSNANYMILLRYHKRSDYLTDEEYLKEE